MGPLVALGLYVERRACPAPRSSPDAVTWLFGPPPTLPLKWMPPPLTETSPLPIECVPVPITHTLHSTLWPGVSAAAATALTVIVEVSVNAPKAVVISWPGICTRTFVGRACWSKEMQVLPVVPCSGR